MLRRTHIPQGLLAGLVVALLGACASGGSHSAALNAGSMSNAEIVHFAAAANSGEIQLAQLALEKSTNPAVQSFAREMIADHAAANSQAASFMPRFGLSNASVITSASPTSASMQPAPSVATTATTAAPANAPIHNETPPPAPVTSATTGNAAAVHTEAPKPAPVTAATTGDGVNVSGAATTSGAGNAQSAPPASAPTGQPSATSVQASTAQALATLSQLSGAAFDRAYIAQQVTLHQWLLQSMDSSLLPSVRDAQLKDLLTGMRPKVQGHLDAARQLLLTLGS